jgi:hypothetical protein
MQSRNPSVIFFQESGTSRPSSAKPHRPRAHVSFFSPIPQRRQEKNANSGFRITPRLQASKCQREQERLHRRTIITELAGWKKSLALGLLGLELRGAGKVTDLLSIAFGSSLLRIAAPALSSPLTFVAIRCRLYY